MKYPFPVLNIARFDAGAASIGALPAGSQVLGCVINRVRGWAWTETKMNIPFLSVLEGQIDDALGGKEGQCIVMFRDTLIASADRQGTSYQQLLEKTLVHELVHCFMLHYDLRTEGARQRRILASVARNEGTRDYLQHWQELVPYASHPLVQLEEFIAHATDRNFGSLRGDVFPRCATLARMTNVMSGIARHIAAGKSPSKDAMIAALDRATAIVADAQRRG